MNKKNTYLCRLEHQTDNNMKHIMVHPNGINRMEVAPHKVKRLLGFGWREETEVPQEVINFKNIQGPSADLNTATDKVKEMIKEKTREAAEEVTFIPEQVELPEPEVEKTDITPVAPEIKQHKAAATRKQPVRRTRK